MAKLQASTFKCLSVCLCRRVGVGVSVLSLPVCLVVRCLSVSSLSRSSFVPRFPSLPLSLCLFHSRLLRRVQLSEQVQAHLHVCMRMRLLAESVPNS